MAYDPNTYQNVKTRIDAFWLKFPNGRIINEIVLINETGVVIKSSVYTDRDDKNPVAVDFAQENVSPAGVNKTSWVENCSSSATGRAISLLGNELSPTYKRPSHEEMTKVWAARNWMEDAEKAFKANNIEALRELVSDGKQFNLDIITLNAIIAMGKELAEKVNASDRKELRSEAPAESRSIEAVKDNSSDKK
jgi:hypothetical protein